jgi:hypothetical protein
VKKGMIFHRRQIGKQKLKRGYEHYHTVNTDNHYIAPILLKCPRGMAHLFSLRSLSKKLLTTAAGTGSNLNPSIDEVIVN